MALGGEVAQEVEAEGLEEVAATEVIVMAIATINLGRILKNVLICSILCICVKMLKIMRPMPGKKLNHHSKATIHLQEVQEVSNQNKCKTIHVIVVAHSV